MAIKIQGKNVSPIRLEVLVTVVNRKKAEFYADLIQTLGANMQITLMAKGTAEDKMLEYLGLSDSDKAVILSMVREDALDSIIDALNDRFRTVKEGKGIAVSVPFSSIMGASAFAFFANEQQD